jgi:chromate reductase
MRIALICGSLRKASLNARLLSLVATRLSAAGHESDVLDLKDFSLVAYDGDLEAQGMPESCLRLKTALDRTSAVVVTTPEYNFSMPGHLKNTLDWLSRTKPQPWRGKPVLLLSASPSLVGGNRGLWSLRVPLEMSSALVYPDMFSLASAADAFGSSGLKDASMQKRLDELVDHFAAFAGRNDPFKHV